MNKYLIFLVSLGFLVYFNSLFNSFVWDDEEQIIKNAPVHLISNITSFFSGSTFNSGGGEGFSGLYYKPLMTTAFSLIYSIFGANAFYFHIFQVVLHIINTVILFYIFKFFLKKEFLAFTLAIIFLIHPISTEAVVYISALQEPLFFFFGSLAVLLVIKEKWPIPVSILLLMSFLSKETGLLFLPLIFFYAIIYKQKFYYVFGGVVSFLIYLFLRFTVANIPIAAHNLSSITTMTFWERLINIPQIIIFYLKTFIFPKDLFIDQQWAIRGISWQKFYFPLLILLLLLAIFLFCAIFLWKNSKATFPLFTFFSFWFLLGMGLHLQLFPLDLTVAERWFYMPMPGILGMIASLSMALKIKDKPLSNLLIAVLIITVPFLFIKTITRNINWQNGLVLYSHDIKLSPPNYNLENNLGVELYRKGSISESKTHFEKSVALAPGWWTNWNNLGAVAEAEGDLESAEKHYKKAIGNGKYYLAYSNLAKVLLKQEKFLEARDFSKDALKVLPKNSDLWQVLAISEEKVNQLK